MSTFTSVNLEVLLLHEKSLVYVSVLTFYIKFAIILIMITGHESIIFQPENFRQSLDTILSRQLSPEVIDTYASDALDDLVELTEHATASYSSQPTLAAKNQTQTEDFAFSYFNLGELEQSLDHVADLAESIDAIDDVIKNAAVTSGVIIPPVRREVNVKEGDGSFREKNMHERLKTTLFILQQDFGIDIHDKTKLRLTAGGTEGIMRKASYNLIEIPELERVILVCDEEGNVSYVFDSALLAAQNFQEENLASLSKDELNELLMKNAAAGQRIVYSKSFVANMISAINTPAGNDTAIVQKSYLYPRADSDVISIDAARKELKIDRATLIKIMNDVGIVATRYVFTTVEGDGFPLEQMDVVKDHPFFEIPLAEGKAVSLNELAKELGTDHKFIRRRAEAEGLTVGEWRFGKTKKIGRGLSLEDADTLRESKYFQTPVLTDDEITISSITDLLSSNRPTVVNKAKELGINIFDRRSSGQVSTTMTKLDFERLKQHPFYQMAKNHRGNIRD